MMRIPFAPKLTAARAAAFAMVLLNSGTAPALAATISRSAEVKASVAAVWSLIGPFCAIKDWLPPVGQCIEDGKAPPTRGGLLERGSSGSSPHGREIAGDVTAAPVQRLKQPGTEIELEAGAASTLRSQ